METDAHSQHTDEPSLDTAFTLLRDRRRRHLVSVLADRKPPVSLTELATAVAARELETDAAEASDAADEEPPETTTEVAATLHHVHLPKLTDGGLVAYDSEAKTVTDAHVEAMAPLSELSDDLDC